MKLIIDIPEETYKGIMLGKWDVNGLAFYVKTGTPLDDVKAEIEKLDEGITSYNHDNPWVYKSEVLMILDNIGSEVKPDETDN